MGKTKVRIDKNQSYILDIFLRENIEKCQQKTPEEIAKICADELGFEISPSTISMTRKAMVSAGVEVWEEPPRKKMTVIEKEIVGLKKQIAEQDKKFAIVFDRLHKLRTVNGVIQNDDLQGEMQWSN